MKVCQYPYLLSTTKALMMSQFCAGIGSGVNGLNLTFNTS